MTNQKRSVVDLTNQPHSLEGLSPQVAGMQRRKIGLKKSNVPPGGGALSIPALEQPPLTGRTMAQQAELSRTAEEALKQAEHANPLVAGAYSPGSPPPVQGIREQTAVNEHGQLQRSKAQIMQDLQTLHAAEQAAAEEGEAEEEKEEEEEVFLPDHGLTATMDLVMNDILRQPKQRTVVEKRITDVLNLTHLVLKNFVEQRVPIIPPTAEGPGLVPTYRSLEADEEMAVKLEVSKIADKYQFASGQYLVSLQSLLQLAVALRAINGQPVPYGVRRKAATKESAPEIDPESLWECYRWLVRKPSQMLASLLIHHTYFELRVRKLFDAERVGNG